MNHQHCLVPRFVGPLALLSFLAPVTASHAQVGENLVLPDLRGPIAIVERPNVGSAGSKRLVGYSQSQGGMRFLSIFHNSFDNTLSPSSMSVAPVNSPMEARGFAATSLYSGGWEDSVRRFAMISSSSSMHMSITTIFSQWDQGGGSIQTSGASYNGCDTTWLPPCPGQSWPEYEHVLDGMITGGDLDGDGNENIITYVCQPSISNSGELVYRLGIGTAGGKIATGLQNLGGSDRPRVVSSDLSGNGRADVVFSYMWQNYDFVHSSIPWGPMSEIRIQPNTGGEGGNPDIHFSEAHASFTTWGYVNGLAIGDVTGNGYKDIIFSAAGASGLTNHGIGMLRNKRGDVGYNPSDPESAKWELINPMISGDNFLGLAVADVNFNGYNDIVFAASSGLPGIYYNTNGNASSWSLTELNGPTNSGRPYVSDISTNFRNEIIFATTSGVNVIHDVAPAKGPSLRQASVVTGGGFNPGSQSRRFNLVFDKQTESLIASDLQLYSAEGTLATVSGLSTPNNGLSWNVDLNVSAGAHGHIEVRVNPINSIEDADGNPYYEKPRLINETMLVDRRVPVLQGDIVLASTPLLREAGVVEFQFEFDIPINHTSLRNGVSFEGSTTSPGPSFPGSWDNYEELPGGNHLYSLFVNSGSAPGVVKLRINPGANITSVHNVPINIASPIISDEYTIFGSPVAAFVGGESLHLEAFGHNNITVTTVGSEVRINNNRPQAFDGSLLVINPNNVVNLYYIGGTGGNQGNDVVNLTSVTKTNFPNLDVIALSAGSGGTNTLTLPNLVASNVDISVTGSGTTRLVLPSSAHDVVRLTGAGAGRTDDSRVLFTGVSRMTLGEGNNTVHLDPSGSLVGDLNGGGGINTLVDHISTELTVNFETGVISRSLGQILGFRNFQTTTGAVNFTGTNQANVVTGAGGNDVINGVGGNNTLTVAGGNNTLEGGSGNDLLIAGSGNDVLTGGGGNDEYRFPANTGGTNIINEDPGGGNDLVNASALFDGQFIQFSPSGFYISGDSGYTIESSGLNVETFHLGSGSLFGSLTASGPGTLSLNNQGAANLYLELGSNIGGDIILNQAAGPSDFDLEIVDEGNFVTGYTLSPTNLAWNPVGLPSRNIGVSNLTSLNLSFSNQDAHLAFTPNFSGPILIDGRNGYNTLLVNTANPEDIVLVDNGDRSGTIQAPGFGLVTYSNIDEVDIEGALSEITVGSIHVEAFPIITLGDGEYRAAAPALINGMLVYESGADMIIHEDNLTIDGNGPLRWGDVNGQGVLTFANGNFHINAATGSLSTTGPDDTLVISTIPVIIDTMTIESDAVKVSGAFDSELLANTGFTDLKVSDDGVTLSEGVYHFGLLPSIFSFAVSSESFDQNSLTLDFESEEIPGLDSFQITINGNAGSIGLTGSVQAACSGSDCLEVTISTPQFLADGGIRIASAALAGVPHGSVSLSGFEVNDAGAAFDSGSVILANFSVSMTGGSFGASGVSVGSATINTDSILTVSVSDLFIDRNSIAMASGSVSTAGRNFSLTGLSYQPGSGTFVAGSASASGSGFSVGVENFTVNGQGNVAASGGHISIGVMTLALSGLDFSSNFFQVGSAVVSGLPESGSAGFSFTIENLFVNPTTVTLGSGSIMVGGFEITLGSGQFSGSQLSFSSATLKAGSSVDLNVSSLVAGSGGIVLGGIQLDVASFSVLANNVVIDTDQQRLEAGLAQATVDGVGQLRIDDLTLSSSGDFGASGGSITVATGLVFTLLGLEINDDSFSVGSAVATVKGEGVQFTELHVDSDGVTLSEGSVNFRGFEFFISNGSFNNLGFAAGEARLDLDNMGSLWFNDLAVIRNGFTLGGTGFTLAGLTVAGQIAGADNDPDALRIGATIIFPSVLDPAQFSTIFVIKDDNLILEFLQICTPNVSRLRGTGFRMPAFCFLYEQGPPEKFAGSGLLTIPAVFDVEAGAVVIGGELDEVSMAVGNMNKPIGKTGMFLQAINGSVSNLTGGTNCTTMEVVSSTGQLETLLICDNGSIVVHAGATFTAGPRVGGMAYMTGDVQAEVADSYLRVDGTVRKLVLHMGSASATARWAGSPRGVSFSGSMTYSYILTGHGSGSIMESGAVSGSVGAKVSIPDEIPLVGGRSLASVTFGFQNTPEVMMWARSEILLWYVLVEVRVSRVDFDAGWKGMPLHDWESPVHIPIRVADKSDLGYSYYNLGLALGEKVYHDDAGILTTGKTDTIDLHIDEDGIAIIRLHHENPGGNPSFNLIDPLGNVYTPESHPLNATDLDQFAHWLANPVARDGGYLIPKPIPGDYTVVITDPGSLGAYTVELLRQEIEGPKITVDNVWSDGTDLHVEYEVTHPEDLPSTVTLWLDNDRRNYNGMLLTDEIVDQIGVNIHSHDLATTTIPAGLYYVYAVAEDGINPPSRMYYPNPVFVTNPDTPPAITNFKVQYTDDMARVSFDPVEGSNVISYRIDYSIHDDTSDYTNHKSLPPDVTETVISGLEWGRPYRFTVRSIREISTTAKYRKQNLALISTAALPYMNPKSAEKLADLTRDELVELMTDSISNEMRRKGNSPSKSADPGRVKALAQQAAFVARYNSKSAMDSKPSKAFANLIEESISKRVDWFLKDEDPLTDDDFPDPFDDYEPIEYPDEIIFGHIESFEYAAIIEIPFSSSGNWMPVFVSNPGIHGVINKPYQYQAVVLDPDDDDLTFSLLEAPAGMTVSPDGLVEFTPDTVDDFPVTLQVSDGINNVTQSWTLFVGDIDQIFSLQFLSLPLTKTTPGDKFTYLPIVGGGYSNTPISLELVEAPGGMILDEGTGEVSWNVPQTQGSHRVVLLATQEHPETDEILEGVQVFYLDVDPFNPFNPIYEDETRIDGWSTF